VKKPWAAKQGAKRRRSWLEPRWEKQTPTANWVFSEPGRIKVFLQAMGGIVSAPK